MKSSLTIVSILAIFIALLVANNLMEKYVNSITYIDLGTLFVLGLISGVAAGIIFGSNMRNKSATE